MVRFFVVTGRLVIVLAVFLLLHAAGAVAEPVDRSDRTPRVLVTRVDTEITPVVADHVAAGLRRADSGDFDAYVIELDTPGGLITSMREIVKDVLASPVPVIVYVTPAGARAGSAGAIITFAAHVSVMAPGTAIGAATPVGIDGSDLSAKIVNDAAAQAEALAQLRGRNVQFAVDTVREGRSAAVDEAVRLGAVDAKASSLHAALKAADGRSVIVAPNERMTVRSADATVERYDLGLFRRILQVLADPNIAFLLLILGALGLLYELAAPGVGVGGATGAIALLLALFSLSVLPVSVVGLALLAVAIVLFVAELLAPGVAGFALAGAVVLVLSAIFLFDEGQGVSVDLAVVLPTAVVVAAAAVLAGRLAARTRKLPSVSTGTDVFTGQSVTVREADGTTGSTFAEGAWWSLRSVGPALRAGDTARIVAVEDLVLLVDPRSATEPPEHTSSEQGRDTS
jgi:membrane-bound serine protease (ClpP class)